MAKVIHVEDIENLTEFLNVDTISVCENSIYRASKGFIERIKFMKDFEPEYLENIKGKNLVCDCSYHGFNICHGQILLDFANPPQQLEFNI